MLDTLPRPFLELSISTYPASPYPHTPQVPPRAPSVSNWRLVGTRGQPHDCKEIRLAVLKRRALESLWNL